MAVTNPATTGRGKYVTSRSYVLEIPLSECGPIVVSAASTAAGFGTVKICDLPEGNILFNGAVMNIAMGAAASGNVVTEWDGDISLGTAAAEDTTLNGNEVNIIPSSAVKAAADKDLDQARVLSTTTEQGAIFDNTDGSLDINLNMLIDAADITDDESVSLTLSGTLYFAYTLLGDD
jgi:hypothetical protein